MAPQKKKIEEIDPMDAVLQNIEKSMGRKGKDVKSPFSRFGKKEKVTLDAVSFGVEAIDEASYIGGIPRGKMVELFGPESSGKSLLTLFLIAQAQKSGLNCALLDVEQSFDPKWAKMHGVDVDKLIFSNDFSCGEEALEYTYQFCASGAIGLVIVDSTAALTPRSELEGTLEDNAVIGEQARMMSRACRKIMTACSQTGTICLFINQIRSKIGVMFGNPETTPGGKALKFYSHMRLKVYRKGSIKIKENGEAVVVGQTSVVTFVKNKTARPYGQAEFKIIFDPNSMNPVVMLCNALKQQKLVFQRNGVIKIKKGVAGFDDVEDTGATNMVELSNYLINKNLVITMLEELTQIVEESDIDSAILEMRSDESKIVSPDGKAQFDATKVEDASTDDIKEDIDGQEDDPE